MVVQPLVLCFIRGVREHSDVRLGIIAELENIYGQA